MLTFLGINRERNIRLDEVLYLSRPRVSSSGSYAPLIARLPRESGLMSVHSTVRLECRIIVSRHKLTVLNLCRVVVVDVDWCCMLENTFDRNSS